MIYKLMKIYIKNIIRKKSNIYFSLILTIYNIYVCMVSLKEFDTAYYILASNTYCIVGFFLFSILLGYSISVEDNEIDFKDVILSINNGFIKSLLSKFLASISFLTALVTLNIVIVYISFIISIKDNSLILYLDLLKYTVFYWYLPLIFFLLIGMVIGEKIKNKISYLFCLLIAILFSNLNNYIFNYIQYFFEKDILTFSWYLTLGNFEPGVLLYNGLYGFNSRIYDFSKVILLLSIAIIIVLITYKKYIKIKFKFLITITFFIIIICGINLYNNRYRISEIGNIDAPIGNKLNRYYSVDSNTKLNNKDIKFSNYDIEKCYVEITPKNKFKFNVEVDIKVNEDTSYISFILLHTLKIINVYDSNGNKINFDQQDDLVNLILDYKLKKGEKITIKLNYEGYMPSDYYIENNFVYLTSELPIVPSNIFMNPIEQLDYFGYTINNTSVKTNYTVKVNSNNNNIYSNLDKKENNKFEGFDSGFVILLNNRYDKVVYDNIECFYPKSYIYNVKELNNLIKYVNNTIYFINKLTGKNSINKINKIFVNTQQYDYGSNIDLYKNTLIFNSRFLDDFEFFETDIARSLIIEVISELLNNSDITYEERLLEDILLETIMAIYRNNDVHFINLIGDKGEFYLRNEQYEKYENMKILWIAGEKLKKIFDSGIDMSNLIRDYINLFENDNVTSEDVLKILEKYEEL